MIFFSTFLWLPITFINALQMNYEEVNLGTDIKDILII